MLSIGRNGRKSVSASRRRHTPKMSSPPCRSTIISYSCSIDTYPLFSTVFKLQACFQWAAMAEMLISAARGRSRPEMTIPFDSLTPSFYISSVQMFRLCLTVQKLFHVFNIAGISHRGTKNGAVQ